MMHVEDIGNLGLNDEQWKLVHEITTAASNEGVTSLKLVDKMLCLLIERTGVTDPNSAAILTFRSFVMLTILARHLTLQQIAEAWILSGQLAWEFKRELEQSEGLVKMLQGVLTSGKEN